MGTRMKRLPLDMQGARAARGQILARATGSEAPHQNLDSSRIN
jgi:hypothetical protein